MTKIVEIYFKSVRTGRLQRMQYFAFSVAAVILVVLAVFGLVVGIGIAEQIIGGDIEQAQALLREKFSGIALLGIFLFIVVIGFAQLNIAAKRVRDIGLPGWPLVLAMIVLAYMISLISDGYTQQGIRFAFWLVLVLMPSGSFGASATDAE